MPHTVKNRVDASSDYPLDIICLRLIDAESLDKNGRFGITKEELLFSTSGKLRRLYVLEEHDSLITLECSLDAIVSERTDERLFL